MTIKQRFANSRIGRAINSWLVDAANPRERAQRPYERVTASSFNQEFNSSDRLQVLSDSRKLFANLGPAKAPIVDKATYSIGRAWAPKFLGKNKAWGHKATAYLTDKFFPLCDIRGGGDWQTQLYLTSVSIDRDGDVAILLTKDGSGFARIQLIPSHCIGSRTDGAIIETGPYKGLRQIDGVAINEFSSPVGYCILGEDEDGDRWVSARDLIFIYEPEWIEQVRGQPCFTHAILDLRDLRTVQGYERLASALCSSIGLVEHNETGGPDLSDPVNLGRAATASGGGITTEDMAGGTVKYFRANSGSKLEFLKSERPGEAWESFMNRLIRNAYSGAGWPYEMSWDSSALGGANIRLIVSKAMRAVQDRQDLIRPAAKRIVGYAIAVAINLGELEPDPEWWKWDFSMPQKVTVDYGRDAKAQRDDYLCGIENLTGILDERGETLAAHIAERKAENAALAAAGLPFPGPYKESAIPDDAQKKAA